MVHLKNATSKFGVFDEKTCFFNADRLSGSLRFHLRKCSSLGNLRQNIGQKAQTSFWKTVKNSHFLELFWSKGPQRIFVGLLPLIGWRISKRGFFDEKERKLMQKQWFFESFLWDSAHKPKIHLFRSFFTFDPWHYRLYVQKPCVFCVFSRIFRAFWETRLDLRIGFGAGGGIIGGRLSVKPILSM